MMYKFEKDEEVMLVVDGKIKRDVIKNTISTAHGKEYLLKQTLGWHQESSLMKVINKYKRVKYYAVGYADPTTLLFESDGITIKVELVSAFLDHKHDAKGMYIIREEEQ